MILKTLLVIGILYVVLSAAVSALESFELPTGNIYTSHTVAADGVE